MDLKSNGLNWVLILADVGLIYKTANATDTVATTVQVQLAGKSVRTEPRDNVRNQSKQSANPVVYPQQQSSRISNASSILQRRSHRTHEHSQIPRNPLWLNDDVLRASRINKTQAQETKFCAESHGCKGHRTIPSVPAVSGCDIKRRWLWPGPHNTVTVQPAEALDRVQNEAMKVIQRATKNTPIVAMLYLLDLPPVKIRHKVGQVKVYLSAMQNH